MMSVPSMRVCTKISSDVMTGHEWWLTHLSGSWVMLQDSTFSFLSDFRSPTLSGNVVSSVLYDRSSSSSCVREQILKYTRIIWYFMILILAIRKKLHITRYGKHHYIRVILILVFSIIYMPKKIQRLGENVFYPRFKSKNMHIY